MNKLIEIQDIYPLTIVSRRYGGFAIINAENDCDAVSALSGDEEYAYYAHKLMWDNWSYVKYGIGSTILEAYEDYLTYDGDILKSDL